MIHNRQDNFKRTVSNSRNVLKQRYQIREIIITSIVVAVILVLGIQVWHAHQQEVQLQNKIQTEQVHLKHEKEAEKNLKNIKLRDKNVYKDNKNYVIKFKKKMRQKKIGKIVQNILII